jgi:hypothetical protein
MGKIKTHAGSFQDMRKHRFEGRKFIYEGRGFWSPYFPKKINSEEIISLEQINEDNKVKVLGAAGWGLAGAAVLGPDIAIPHCARLCAVRGLGVHQCWWCVRAYQPEQEYADDR